MATKEKIYRQFSRVNRRLISLICVLIIVGLGNTQSSSESAPATSTAVVPVATPNATLKCIVDRCANCPNFTNLTCTNCASGYYLRNYNDAGNVYNACWSVTKLIFGIFGLMILLYLTCGICYWCFLCGKKADKVRGNPYMQDRREFDSEMQRYPRNRGDYDDYEYDDQDYRQQRRPENSREYSPKRAVRYGDQVASTIVRRIN